jgi:hypothetical protein
MLDRRDYKLLEKYDSTEPQFDPNELATVFEILNLEPLTFAEAKSWEYSALVSQALREQNKVMTELAREYLNLEKQGSRIEAMRYVVQNIAKIKSPFMLDVLVGVVHHGPDNSPLHWRSRRQRPDQLWRSRIGESWFKRLLGENACL